MEKSLPETGGGPVATAFLKRYLDDLRAGHPRSLAEYQALFPGHEQEIAAEYARLAAEEEPEAPGAVPGAGSRIGHYRLLEPLGRGGFGVVWSAEDLDLPRRVALKLLALPERFRDGEERRFRREAEAAARLDHPGLCPVYDAGVAEGHLWIAMRLVAGETLARRLERGRESGGPPSTRAQALAVALQIERVARALHAAHEGGILHRDMKPANVMVQPDGEPVLLDFGLARELDAGGLSRPWEAFGTLAYMSPEQLESAGDLDPRADVWSLGVTLFECLTLERPFEAHSLGRLLDAVRSGTGRDPRARNPAVPRDLGTVVATALEPDRDRRYHSALALAEDLRRVAASEPIAARPAGPLLRVSRWARRRPAWATLAAVLALLLPAAAAGAGYLMARAQEIADARAQARRARQERALERGFLQIGGWEPGAAHATFEALLAEDPGRPEAVAGAAIALLRDGRDQEALAFLDARPAAVEALPALAGLRADALRKLGREDEARSVEEALGEPAAALDAWVQGVRALRAAEEGEPGAPARALELFSIAVLLARSATPILHFQRAEAAGRAGDLDAARTSARALAALWPDSSPAAFFAGFALHGAGDPAAAVPHYERAVALDPDSFLARNALGAAYMETGDREGAMSTHREMLARDPADVTAHYNLALCLRDGGDHGGAIRHFRAALEQDPEWTQLHHNLVQAYLSTGDAAGAVAAARECLAAGGEQPLTRFALARALAAHGELAAASGEASAALQAIDAAPHPDPGLRAALEDLLAEITSAQQD